jgi:hypothetical protein
LSYYFARHAWWTEDSKSGSNFKFANGQLGASLIQDSKRNSEFTSLGNKSSRSGLLLERDRDDVRQRYYYLIAYLHMLEVCGIGNLDSFHKPSGPFSATVFPSSLIASIVTTTCNWLPNAAPGGCPGTALTIPSTNDAAGMDVLGFFFTMVTI